MATEPKDQDKKLQDDLKDSAHRIWLAGLGALAVAEEEGTKLFKQLVDRGRDVEDRGKVEVDKAKDKAKSSAENAWEGLSSKLDEAVTRALHRLGVPTREEIRTLTQRVEELNHKVEALKPRITPAGAGAAASAGSTMGGAPKSTRGAKGPSKLA